MKCEHCGAKLGKELICPKCGHSRSPRKRSAKKIIIASAAGVAAAAAGGFAALRIYDSVHQSNALLPGIYAGMTKAEFYTELKQRYSALYGGKVIENPFVREGADRLSYTAYAEYCNALSLNRPMELEVTFVSSGGTQYVDSYTLSFPYITETASEIKDDIREKVIPVLEGKYGASLEDGGEYKAEFGIRESVSVYISRADSLLDYNNYSATTFHAYGDNNYCCRITYQGSSSHTLFNVLKHVK